ncbi:MAG: hypothetical protein CM15mP102_08980 [Flavobacteriales bacterium]|nr:MAG: hypothetical protein CM15mP102_08980 [Flavobacteriales bacterium]
MFNMGDGCNKNDIAEKIIPVASDWKANDWLIANTFYKIEF